MYKIYGEIRKEGSNTQIQPFIPIPINVKAQLVLPQFHPESRIQNEIFVRTLFPA